MNFFFLIKIGLDFTVKIARCKELDIEFNDYVVNAKPIEKPIYNLIFMAFYQKYLFYNPYVYMCVHVEIFN